MLLLSSLLLALTSSVMGFDFNIETSNLQQCGSADITWSGGSPPFNLVVIVSDPLAPETRAQLILDKGAFDYPTNLTLPDSAYSNGQGSYRWQVNCKFRTELDTIARI